jgi:hypothetical protein
MKQKTQPTKITATRIAVIFLLAALLPGCSFGSMPSNAPTVDTRPTFEAVQTEAAKTVVAELTRLAPQVEPVEPTAVVIVVTATEGPTATEAIQPTAIPSFTPVTPTLTSTNTRIPATLAPVATKTPVNSSCSITSQSVDFGDDFPKNADFDGKWVVKNTGTTTWSASDVDIKYLTGQKFQTKVDAIDLGSDVEKNESYTVVIDMKTPDSIGRYSTTWGFVEGGKVLCYLSITLDVTK